MKPFVKNCMACQHYLKILDGNIDDLKDGRVIGQTAYTLAQIDSVVRQIRNHIAYGHTHSKIDRKNHERSRAKVFRIIESLKDKSDERRDEILKANRRFLMTPKYASPSAMSLSNIIIYQSVMAGGLEDLT